MKAARLLGWLEEQAPLHLAAEWDNVGLILEPAGRNEVQRVLLTIDLTPAVWREAETGGADLILAYHPPIFGGLKKIRASRSSERVVAEVLRAGTAVYSPHTAMDAAAGGMTEWLASSLGEHLESLEVIDANQVDPRVGFGRRGKVKGTLGLQEATAALKKHLNLSHLRVAEPPEPSPIRSVAFCPGAGGSLFSAAGPADLYVTGEMRHHDVLALTRRGASVILADHTNTERGFLQVFAERMRGAFAELEVACAETDRDPLEVR